MTMNVTSSLNVCPINFEKFGTVNRITNNLDASLLFSKLKFHQANSKIKKNGKTWVIRSREQIASWFGFSTKKVDGILSSLESMGLLEKKVSLWYGKKRLFINTSNKIDIVPVNIKSLGVLIDVTGSVRASLIFSKIAFAFANTKITNENKKWCCIKKQDLANWSGLSIRTIDGILETLSSKGLILKKKFIWNDRLQSHFHVPDFAIKILRERFEGLNQNEAPKAKSSEKSLSQNCRRQPAEKGSSIIIRTNSKKTNNITSKPKVSTTVTNTDSDIIFDLIGNKLSSRQVNYLEAALTKTIERKRLIISNPTELVEQIKFSVLNVHQHKGISSFKHVVSRCMKILSDGNWRTPIGFHNHSKQGKKIKLVQKQREDQWLKLKEQECKRESAIDLIKIKNDGLTDKALAIASQIVRLTKTVKEGSEITVANFVEDLTAQIQNLIGQGADKSKVVEYLNSIN